MPALLCGSLLSPDIRVFNQSKAEVDGLLQQIKEKKDRIEVLGYQNR